MQSLGLSVTGKLCIFYGYKPFSTKYCLFIQFCRLVNKMIKLPVDFIFVEVANFQTELHLSTFLYPDLIQGLAVRESENGCHYCDQILPLQNTMPILTDSYFNSILNYLSVYFGFGICLLEF